MLNVAIVTGRIKKVRRTEGYSGQSRMYVEVYVERDTVNPDGERGVDGVELCLYGKQADLFKAEAGETVSVIGSLRTRYGEPDERGYRTPATYVDVRRVYESSGRD